MQLLGRLPFVLLRLFVLSGRDVWLQNELSDPVPGPNDKCALLVGVQQDNLDFVSVARVDRVGHDHEPVLHGESSAVRKTSISSFWESDSDSGRYNRATPRLDDIFSVAT
jgi:hypothetical protein